MAETVMPRDAISRLSNFKTATLTSQYITDGRIRYVVCGKIMFFAARIKPTQNITTSIGMVVVNDDEFPTMDDPIVYPVAEGTSSSNTNSGKLAWTWAKSKQFRINGAMSSGTYYYFGGVATIV